MNLIWILTNSASQCTTMLPWLNWVILTQFVFIHPTWSDHVSTKLWKKIVLSPELRSKPRLLVFCNSHITAALFNPMCYLYWLDTIAIVPIKDSTLYNYIMQLYELIIITLQNSILNSNLLKTKFSISNEIMLMKSCWITFM